MNTDRLYYLSQDLDAVSHLEQVETAIDAGINWVQLRSKRMDYAALVETARMAVDLAAGTDTRIIINDHVHVAAACGARGVHLGKSDMDLGDARAILGEGPVIGCTANSAGEALALWRRGADYIGLGPFRFTATKSNLSPVLGVDGIRCIMQELEAAGMDIPVFAIGGIALPDVGPLMEAGIYGLAVSSSINHADDRKKMMEKFQRALLKYQLTDEVRTTGKQIYGSK